MRRVVIRNLKNPRPIKPRLFDVLVDGEEVYFEVKAKPGRSEIIALKDVMEQISSSDPKATRRVRVRGAPK